jgi:hypothetical protein
MTTKPQLLLFTTYLAVIGILLLLLLAPSPSVMWLRLDPVGYSMWHVRNAHSFTVPCRNDIGAIEQPVPSWRTVISNGTDTQLAALARAPNPVARLYALAALEIRDPIAAVSLQHELSRDSAQVALKLTCAGQQTVARVSDISAIVGTVSFARALRDDNCPCD